MSARVRARLLPVLVAAAGCAAPMRPLRVTVAETSGDVAFSLETPVERVACGVRDLRRETTDPAAYREIWAAQCRDTCQAAINYGDRTLEHSRPPEALVPSPEGLCYECLLEGRGGRGVIRFRIGRHGGVEPCRL